MERLLSAIAAAIAGCVALLLPAIVAYIGYTSQRAVLTTEAEINARLVSQLINSNPTLWQAESLRLEELLSRRPGTRIHEVRAVFDLQGNKVSEVSEELAAPLMVQQHPVYDAGHAVGTLRITRSLRPLMLQVLLVSAASVLLGGAVFLALRLLPLRALRRARAHLIYQAHHDSLTGLPNRVLFRKRLAQAMERAQNSGRVMALLFLDLDRFKGVNDSLGHEFGDQLLCHVGRTLEACLQAGIGPLRRRGDRRFFVARLAGDEFTAIVESVGRTEDVASLARHILDELERPFRYAGHEVYVSATIGVALFPLDNTDLEGLIRQADLAMYRAKELGRSSFHFYNDELNQAAQDRISLQSHLRHALEASEFVLYYQPKAELPRGMVTGVEALLHWQRPQAEVITPDKFMHALEDNGLIVPVGAWVIATACAQLATWDRTGMPPLSVAVNLSARQFRQSDLAQQIAKVLRDTGIAPHRLELELTETMLMEDTAHSRAVLHDISRMGVRVAVDDFGIGHSSLADLKRFSVDILKIDKSFVRDVPHNADDCAIAQAIVALGHGMKLLVVADGVETTEQSAFLDSVGCDAIQGSLLTHALPPEELHDWLQRFSLGAQGATPSLVTESSATGTGAPH